MSSRGAKRRPVLATLLAAALAHSLSAQIPLLESLIEAGHWRRARAAAEALLRTSPDDPMVQFLTARCLDAAGDLEGAQALAEKASASDPRNAGYHALLAYLHARQAQGAGILRQAALAGRIRKGAERALALDPRSVEALVILIEFYRQAPGIAGGDKVRAAKLLAELTAIAPARGFIMQAGFLSREPGSSAEVEELLKKAVAAEPGSYQAHTALAEFYASAREKKYADGEALARRAVALAPDRAEAYGILAKAFAAQAKFEDLEAVLKEGEENVPDDLSPAFQAGRVLLQAGDDLPRAEALFQKYLTREPELGAPSHAQAWWRLGQALEKQGRKSEADEAARKALALDPRLAKANRDLRRD